MRFKAVSGGVRWQNSRCRPQLQHQPVLGRIGIKADIEAYIRQCHACQVRRLELQDVSHVGLPRMSGPFEHVHIDLAGPFELRAVTTAPRRKKHGSTCTALST